MDFAARFDEGLSYEAFLAKFGNDEQKRRWAGVHGQVSLTAEQRVLLKSFRREMKVLVVAGTWCGDCVNQCPIFAHFAAENDKIRIRYFDRDASAELAKELSICGSLRAVAVVFERGQFPMRAGRRSHPFDLSRHCRPTIGPFLPDRNRSAG